MKAVNEETLLFLTNKVGVLLALLFFTILIPAVNYHLMNVKLEKEKQQHQEYVAQTSAIIETLSGQVTNLTHKYQQSAFFKKEMDCLAKNIYYEAGNQPIDGQTAVAQVTMNRKNANFANSICGVVYQKTGDICQFSWTCKEVKQPYMPFYERAKEIARNTLTLGYANVKLQNALYFHSQKVNPAWNEDKVVITKIGDHVFYSDK